MNAFNDDNNEGENDGPNNGIACEYLNKRKAIIMSTNKVKLPLHLRKRIKSTHPKPTKNTIFTGPTQELPISESNRLNFSQSSQSSFHTSRSGSSDSQSLRSLSRSNSSQSNSSQHSSCRNSQSDDSQFRNSSSSSSSSSNNR